MPPRGKYLCGSVPSLLHWGSPGDGRRGFPQGGWPGKVPTRPSSGLGSHSRLPASQNCSSSFFPEEAGPAPCLSRIPETHALTAGWGLHSFIVPSWSWEEPREEVEWADCSQLLPRLQEHSWSYLPSHVCSHPGPDLQVFVWQILFNSSASWLTTCTQESDSCLLCFLNNIIKNTNLYLYKSNKSCVRNLVVSAKNLTHTGLRKCWLISSEMRH